MSSLLKIFILIIITWINTSYEDLQQIAISSHLSINILI